MEFIVRNVNEALYLGAMSFDNGSNLADKLGIRWIRTAPRGMSTLEFAGMFTTTYVNPDERVLFSPGRDANPFFHFMEGLWMLAGRNDVEWISQFNSRISQYSDDGVIFNGAYGYRIFHHFDVNQMEAVIKRLTSDPQSRRAVIMLYDPNTDNKESKDIPCNDMMTFKIRSNRLNMRVYNRSNDMIWGAYGANAVHFSMIMEYVAARLGVELGEYSQVTDCMHLYDDNPNWKNIQKESRDGCLVTYDFYDSNKVKSYPMVQDADSWMEDLYYFMRPDYKGAYENSFFSDVAVPMMDTWIAHKTARRGFDHVDRIAASDWRLAATEWLERRYNKLKQGAR